MARYDAKSALPGGAPGPWSEPVEIRYDTRDVLLYAVGIGCDDLRFVYEKHPQFAVFPTFSIRWGGAGLAIDRALIPPSPGPLTIDAERTLERLRPLPLAGSVRVTSRLLAAHPRGKGAAFVEVESRVLDASGDVCVRMVSGSFRRGVERLGDIEPFEGAGQSLSERIDPPARAPDLEVDGEMHGDAALSEDIRRQVFPHSRLEGSANLLVMPNVDAANIAFNLLKTAAGDGLTVGPMLLGAARPVHILTPTATVRRIVNMTALLSVEVAQAQQAQQHS